MLKPSSRYRPATMSFVGRTVRSCAASAHRVRNPSSSEVTGRRTTDFDRAGDTGRHAVESDGRITIQLARGRRIERFNGIRAGVPTFHCSYCRRCRPERKRCRCPTESATGECAGLGDRPKDEGPVSGAGGLHDAVTPAVATKRKYSALPDICDTENEPKRRSANCRPAHY